MPSPLWKLDESMARLQLKSPRSLSGRFIHLTLVTKWSWSWSWMTYCHPFVQCQSALPFSDTALKKFDHENPWSSSCVWSMVKVTYDLENWKVKVMVKSNPLVTFEAWSSTDMFAFRFVAIRQTIFSWDIANSAFDLEKSRSRSCPRSKLTVTFEPWSSINCLLLVSWQSDHFWLRYSKFHIWPWKFKVKVMTKIDQNLIR